MQLKWIYIFNSINLTNRMLAIKALLIVLHNLKGT